MIFEKRFLNLFLANIAICFIFSFQGISQEKISKSFFYVKLIDQNTGNPVVFANVICPVRNWWVVSDTAGMARISVYKGDTLTITSLGFMLTRFLITDSLINGPKPIIIKLQEKKYEIKGVNIAFLGTYESFKYKVLHMKMPEDRLFPLMNQIKFENDKMVVYPIKDQAGIAISGVISSIYDLFSKEAKSKQKLVEIMNHEEKRRIVNIKYTRSLVERVTGLKELQLDEFIIKYRPVDDYIFVANEYEIIGRIMQDFEKYKTLRDTIKH